MLNTGQSWTLLAQLGGGGGVPKRGLGGKARL